MRMRVILLGGETIFGQMLIRLAVAEDIEIIAPKIPVNGWGIASLNQLFIDHKPDAVINAIYYVDWFQAAEIEPESWIFQREIVRYLAEFCHRSHIILLQPSSYRVFDGTQSLAYDEDQKVMPLGSKGAALVEFESQVRLYCERHIIVRFGWLLDGSTKGFIGNFLYKSEKNTVLFAAQDRVGSPTPVDDAARVIFAILKQLDCNAALWGTYHYGGYDVSSSFVVGEAFLVEARNYCAHIVDEITSQAHALHSDVLEEPQNSVLECKKIMHTFGITPRSWRSSLPDIVDYYYRNR